MAEITRYGHLEVEKEVKDYIIGLSYFLFSANNKIYKGIESFILSKIFFIIDRLKISFLAYFSIFINSKCNFILKV